MSTFDIDIFTPLPTIENTSLLLLSPIYDYLEKHGHKQKGEFIIIGDWQTQFLPPASTLEEEAINDAELKEIGDTKVPVMSAEHLVAIALKTGREKDHERVRKFISSKKLNDVKLLAILKKQGLIEKWEVFTNSQQKPKSQER